MGEYKFVNSTNKTLKTELNWLQTKAIFMKGVKYEQKKAPPT